MEADRKGKRRGCDVRGEEGDRVREVKGTDERKRRVKRGMMRRRGAYRRRLEYFRRKLRSLV